MIDFIPLQYYYDTYIYFCFFLVLANLLHANTLELYSIKNIKFLRTSGYILLILIMLYMGLRPLSVIFGDMGSYNGYFTGYKFGMPITTEKDVFFHYYMKLLSYFVSNDGFFLVTAFFYIFPMFLISKFSFKDYWFYAFLMFVVSFSFYSYGVNGIRNGLAASMFLWGLCYSHKKIIMIFLFFIAVLFHKTLLLPVLAYGITLLYNNNVL